MSETGVSQSHWLKQYSFKKGQSGNPNGARNYNNRRRAVREVSIECLERIKEALFDGDIPGLQALSLEPDVTPVEALAITVVMRAMQKGDSQALGMLLDRFIPVIKPVPAFPTSAPAAPESAPLPAACSDDELEQRLRSLEAAE